MNNAMKSISIIVCILLASCSQDHTQQALAQSPHQAIARGSSAPAAPVQMTYKIANTIVANQPMTIDVAINTRLDQGRMLVEVAGHEGATVLGDSQYQFDLAAVSTRPIPLQLRALPADQAERFLAILITVDTEMGAMARSFRIDLNQTAAPPAAEKRMRAGPVIQQ
jgi:hypothetical protein